MADAQPTIDLSQPILRQVGAMGAAYDAWVHAAISSRTARAVNAASASAASASAASASAASASAASAKGAGADVRQPPKWSSSLRIFRSGALELMSHVSWWLVLVVWVPIVIALFLGAVLWLELPPARAAMWGGIGLLLWTLTEYVLHRFVFHYKPRSAFGRKFHFLVHGIHHLDPWDGTRLVFPPLAGLAVAAGLYGLFRIFLPTPESMAGMGGLLIGYMVYDLTHYYTHHAKPRSRWGKFLKAYHLAHHHKHWERMFGVSQPLWDIVFRTGRPPPVARAARAKDGHAA